MNPIILLSNARKALEAVVEHAETYGWCGPDDDALTACLDVLEQYKDLPGIPAIQTNPPRKLT